MRWSKCPDLRINVIGILDNRSYPVHVVPTRAYMCCHGTHAFFRCWTVTAATQSPTEECSPPPSSWTAMRSCGTYVSTSLHAVNWEKRCESFVGICVQVCVLDTKLACHNVTSSAVHSILWPHATCCIHRHKVYTCEYAYAYIHVYTFLMYSFATNIQCVCTCTCTCTSLSSRSSLFYVHV